MSVSDGKATWRTAAGKRALGVALWLALCLAPGRALAEPSACPASCACWEQDGVQKIVCGAVSPARMQQASATTPPGSPAVAEIPPLDVDRWATEEERREALAKRQNALDDALLEAQRARFEARARGEDEARLKALDARFKQVQAQRVEGLRQLDAFGPRD
jgi:hypothetical protein